MRHPTLPCGEGPGTCDRCGRCCIIREQDLRIEEGVDLKMRKRMYETTGVLYLYPLPRYTISVTHEERATMERHAARLGRKPSFLPKKVIHDAEKDEMVVLDWFLDHDVCPFLEGKNYCTIYLDRPGICKAYPEKWDDPSLSSLETVKRGSLSFEEALARSKTLIKPAEIPASRP